MIRHQISPDSRIPSPLESFATGTFNSFFIRNQFNKNLQLEPSSTSQKAFQIRFNSFDRSHSDFILARSNFIFFFDTPQLTPSFNRDGRRPCSAAMLEPVWICHGPLTSFSRKLAPSAQTLVHDRRRSSHEGRLCSAAIRRHSSRLARASTMSRRIQPKN